MSEIEKLYKLADVQPQYKKRIECKEGRRVGQPCGKCPCINCDKSIFEDIMPPFTAEKQIKLLEFNYKYSRVPDIGYIIELKKYDCPHYEEYGAFDTFQEALCADINYHWEYFAEDEKEQIRGILNG